MRRRTLAILALAMSTGCDERPSIPELATPTCTSPEPPAPPEQGTSTEPLATTDGDPTGATDEPDPSTSAGTVEPPEGTAAPTGDESSDGAEPSGGLPYVQGFAGVDGAAWPAPWATAGIHVITAELLGDRGRLAGDTGSVARMVLPGFSETDVDVTITIELDDWTQQGVGIYVRQNGGVLQQTDPAGQGYAAYVEGGYMRLLGVWRETNGVEEPLANAVVPGGELVSGQPYRLRFQCWSEGSATRLRTRIWPADAPEPADWLVDILDDTPVLQGTAGSFAVDVYNYTGTGSVHIDDLRIDPL